MNDRRRDDPASMTGRSERYSESSGRPETLLVRFKEGPWHGKQARYVHALHLPTIRCPGGVYRFLHHDEPAVVYVFDATS